MDAPAHEPHSVLIVDDQPQIVFLLEFTLGAEGFRTFTAHDGLEAMEQVRRHHPSLMVLDVMMPRMDGWSVLQELQGLAADERPQVVMVTALAGAAERARAMGLGAAAFVAKPFDVADVSRTLRELVLAPAS
ncbi:MAG: response regulator transcription factor [Planctomycetaceae bacterium]